MQQLVNYDGDAMDCGNFRGILAVTHPLEEAGATSGACTWVANVIWQDTSIISDNAEGTWERLGEVIRFKSKLSGPACQGNVPRARPTVQRRRQL